MICDAFELNNDGRCQNYKFGDKMKCTQKFKEKIYNFLPWRQKSTHLGKKERRKEKKEEKSIKIEKAKSSKEKRRELYR